MEATGNEERVEGSTKRDWEGGAIRLQGCIVYLRRRSQRELDALEF